METSLLNGSTLTNDSKFINCHEHFGFLVLWLVSSAVCFILGLPITLLILRKLHKRSLKNMSNEIFSINATVINMGYLVIIPFSMLNNVVWRYRPFECIDSIMDAITLCTRPLFMTCICVDCYFAVVHPIAYRSIKKSIIRKAASVIVWLSTIGFIAHKCSDMFVYPPPLNSAPLIFSLPVIIFCDITILQVLRKADSTRKNIHPQKKRALNTIFNSLVMTSIVYIPPVVIFSFADLFPMSRNRYDCTVAMFGYLLSMSGCVIMPVLYLVTLGKRDNLKDSLKNYICI